MMTKRQYNIDLKISFFLSPEPVELESCATSQTVEDIESFKNQFLKIG